MENNGSQVERRKGGRPSASSVLIALGALSAAGTLFLWWLGTIPDEAHPEVGRVVFDNVPGAFVALFYVTVSAFLFLAFYLFAQRAKNWQRGASDDRRKMLQAAPACGS